MQVYLPIAEISVNAFVILGMGGAVGFLSGLFGVGGGFLMTPLLIFSGIPPAVAVATGANLIVASSVSGALAHFRRRTIDIKMGVVLLIGGIFGSFLGVWLFGILRQLGQVDLMISLSYVVFLGIIGSLMFVESARALLRARSGAPASARRSGQHNWVHGLPLKTRFRRSKLYISLVPPFGIGLLVGLLAAIMGVGGGFIMVPAMIYILRMPTNVVIGTSLFQIVFVTGLVTILHAAENQTVDVVLALLLLGGGVVGAQFGARAGQFLKGEQLRALLALMVIGVCLRLLVDLLIQPSELFTLAAAGGGMIRALIAGLAIAALVRPAAAEAQDLVTDISQHLISIESNFTGAQLLLFGAVEGRRIGERTDIAIVVRGPADEVVVRRKARVAGLWVNYDFAQVSNVPGYYAVVSTRPLDEIGSRAVLQRHGIGEGNLNLMVEPPAGIDAGPFRDAVLRLRSRQNLYRSTSGGVVFLGDTLFRANIDVPANVPDGVFSASVYLFENGDLVHAQTTPLYVSKAGFERLVYDLARRQPLFYGILSVVIAVVAGWAASVAFRRG